MGRGAVSLSFLLGPVAEFFIGIILTSILLVTNTVRCDTQSHLASDLN